MQNLKEQSGTVILLGIIITTIILIIGTGISVLVISEIKQSKSVDKSAVAYYLAEYGIEDGLYEVRKRGEKINNIDRNDTAADGSWSRTASDKRDDVSDDLIEEGDEMLINLYDFDAVDTEGIIDYHAGLEAFTIECESPTSTPVSKIEIIIYQFDPNNMVFLAHTEDDINLTNNTVIVSCKDPDNPGDYSEYIGAFIQQKHAIKIKITARYGDVNNLIFKAYTNDNCSTQAQIMDKQIIRSSGTYIQTKAGLQAEIELDPPW